MAAGEPYGLRLFGMRALMSLRLEKSYGTWFREYRPIYTPLEAGIGRYIKLDHEFIGRAAHEAEVAAGGPARRLVAFVVEPDPDDPADVIGDEPIWHDGAVVGWVTSGGYRPPRRASRSRSATCRPRWPTPDGPGGDRVRDRDHRPAPTRPAPAGAAVRPAGPADAPVTEGRVVVDGQPIAFEAGDSVAVAIVRAGEAPGRGGTLCLAGDCGNCLGVVDGVAYVRTCQVPARRGSSSSGIRSDGNPPLPGQTSRGTRSGVAARRRRGRRHRWRGRGPARRGGVAADALAPRRRGRDRGRRRSTPARRSIARTPTGMLHVEAEEVVVATGAAEIQPVCPGNDLDGLLTVRARAQRLRDAGVELPAPRRDRRARARPLRGRCRPAVSERS